MKYNDIGSICEGFSDFREGFAFTYSFSPSPPDTPLMRSFFVKNGGTVEHKMCNFQSEGKGLNDEAHFWLNGYVNKQNCRIWSEANPQVYVETPLHPEKLTVWCALWAGGILLQKR
ncbi:hypothetical protein TNCV_1297451 [Trichonephila clavipes]|nr:hypothetical protein TNCV_1297451 [Trichonephila clavipes]